MVDTDYIKFTAQDGGKYVVYKDEKIISSHVAEREACQTAADYILAFPASEIYYKHDYIVMATLTTQGVTLANTYNLPTNNPPTVESTPSPFFTEGLASQYDMGQHVSDLDSDPLTITVQGPLPQGISFVDPNLIYDGIAGPTFSNNHTITVSDGQAQAVSNIFTIEVTTLDVVIVKADGTGDYTTVGAALLGEVGGTRIRIEPNNPGIEQVFIETLTTWPDGTDGSETILEGKAGETIRIYSNGSSTLLFTGASYGVIKNLTLGNADNEWDFADCGTDSVSTTRNLDLNGCDHFDFRDCQIYGGNSGRANWVSTECDNIRFLRCDFDLAGCNYDARSTHDNFEKDRSDLISSRGSNIIFDECTFAHGGHTPLWVTGPKTVVRNSVCDGYWGDLSTFPGSRTANLEPGNSKRGAPAPYGPGLFEGNIHKRSDDSGDQDAQNAMKFNGRRLISRGNYIFDNDAAGYSQALVGNPDQATDSSEDARIYHNTLVNNGAFLRISDGDQNSDNFTREYCKNNICIDMHEGIAESATVHVWFDTSHVPNQGFPNNWQGALFGSNIFKSQTRAFETRLVFTNPTPWSLSEVEGLYPSVWSDNQETNVTFVNGPARTKAGFQLQVGSNGYKQAESLTAVSTSATNTTVIEVDDAIYFYDGWDLSYFGEAGDYISIGGQIRQITARSVDGSQHTLTLSSAITVTAEDPIFFAGNYINSGSLVWTNIGAGQ